MAITQKTHLVVIIFLTVSFLTAAAQAPITVTIDKPAYSDGNTITISGTVTDQLNIPISIVIKDSSQHIVYIAQTNPNPDNTYSTQVVAGGDIWKTSGTYEIDVTYGGKDKTSKTTFEFTPSSVQPASSSVPPAPSSVQPASSSVPPAPSSTGNQTNATQPVPEFGPLSISVFAISTLAIVIFYARMRLAFKI